MPLLLIIDYFLKVVRELKQRSENVSKKIILSLLLSNFIASLYLSKANKKVERKTKSRCRVFNVRHYNVASTFELTSRSVVQCTSKKCTESVMHVQNCCFVHKTVVVLVA